jgi:hypothetical protein
MVKILAYFNLCAASMLAVVAVCPVTNEVDAGATVLDLLTVENKWSIYYL